MSSLLFGSFTFMSSEGVIKMDGENQSSGRFPSILILFKRLLYQFILHKIQAWEFAHLLIAHSLIAHLLIRSFAHLAQIK